MNWGAVLLGFGILNILVASLAAVCLMLMTRCLQVREIYRALQGDVLVLIAGAIALGAAMEKTGASRYYADLFLGLVSGFRVMKGQQTVVEAAARLAAERRPFPLLFWLFLDVCHVSMRLHSLYPHENH